MPTPASAWPGKQHQSRHDPDKRRRGACADARGRADGRRRRRAVRRDPSCGRNSPRALDLGFLVPVYSPKQQALVSVLGHSRQNGSWPPPVARGGPALPARASSATMRRRQRRQSLRQPSHQQSRLCPPHRQPSRCPTVASSVVVAPPPEGQRLQRARFSRESELRPKAAEPRTGKLLPTAETVMSARAPLTATAGPTCSHGTDALSLTETWSCANRAWPRPAKASDR
jgi:hypothetical protein